MIRTKTEFDSLSFEGAYQPTYLHLVELVLLIYDRDVWPDPKLTTYGHNYDSFKQIKTYHL